MSAIDRRAALKAVDAAVKRSALHGQITAIVTHNDDEAAAVHSGLVALCDDWTEGNACLEYWGTDEDGDEWRIQTRRGEP